MLKTYFISQFQGSNSPPEKVRRKRLARLFFVLPPLLSWPLFGEPGAFPSKDIKSIVIKATRLNLTVKHKRSGFYTVKSSGSLSLRKEKGALIAQSKNFYSKKVWRDGSFKQIPFLEISGPSAPVRVFSFFSQSSFFRWAQPVFISSLKGQIKAVQTKGAWEISLKRGSVDIHRHQGDLTVQGFHLRHFLRSSQGKFNFYINEGLLSAQKSKGKLNFTTDKAKIQLTQFKGSLKGFSQSGAIIAKIQPKTAELSSKEGPIRVSFMGQAPSITAYTEKGQIYGASYLHKQFSGKSTKVSGRIRGSLKKGKASLKSETGNIYIN